MDHVINSIRSYLDVDLDFLRQEWRTGKYKKISDCPSYSSCKAMVDAIHILEKEYHGEKRSMTVKQMFRC